MNNLMENLIQFKRTVDKIQIMILIKFKKFSLI